MPGQKDSADGKFPPAAPEKASGISEEGILPAFGWKKALLST
ncbi:hypothetical protein [Victivallis sp. Marseille-Q1083]|nr:hypothetical protein [Victivallis sp. Marseille-Q1083]